MMDIFYGSENKYINVNVESKNHFYNNGYIVIPPDDTIRAKYFGNHACGTTPNIKIVDANRKVTIYGPNESVIVRLDDVSNNNELPIDINRTKYKNCILPLNNGSNKNDLVIDINPTNYENYISLSNNFKYVISVTSTIESFIDLKKFLYDNKCTNVNVFLYSLSTICDRTNDTIIIKTDNGVSHRIKSITLKQFIYTHIYQNSSLKDIPISLIKCNINSTISNIIEDLLYFSYHHVSQLQLSFEDQWSKSDEITKVKYMFDHFDISNDAIHNIEKEVVVDYLANNSSCSLIFKPNKNKGLLVKSQMPAIIIAYNQYTYITNMVKQLEKYTTDIIIVDNKSDYAPLLKYYENEYKYTLLKQTVNRGHKVCYDKYIQLVAGSMHIITDPDLSFNPKLPDDFIKHLVDISIKYKSYKVGFALLHKAADIRTDVRCHNQTITQWENDFWINRIADDNYELYWAPIDTTFFLINTTVGGPHIRIAGDYTCIHMPWHTDFKKYLKDGEYNAYLKNNKSTSWFK